MDKTEVSIIIPANNEEQTIGGIVKKIKALYPEFEIIVVNDGSTDETGAVAKDAGAIVYSHPYNIGNGAAIKSGIRIASGQVMVFMDADGQHDPEDLKKLIEHIPEFDMVVGARPKGEQASWIRAIGNSIYKRLASYVTKFRVEDLTSGFRAIKSDMAHNQLYLLPNTYSYPTTLTLGMIRSGRSVKYVSVKSQVPFIYPIHDAPLDFQRWTIHGLHKLIREYGFEVMETLAFGEPLETVALLKNIGLSRTLIECITRRTPLAVFVIFLPFSVFINNVLAWISTLISPAGDMMPRGYQLMCVRSR